MRKHQRYLPVRDTHGALTPCFVVIANGPIDHDLVRTGNEAVLRARYEDAALFYRADLNVPPAMPRERLAKLTSPAASRAPRQNPQRWSRGRSRPPGFDACAARIPAPRRCRRRRAAVRVGGQGRYSCSGRLHPLRQ